MEENVDYAPIPSEEYLSPSDRPIVGVRDNRDFSGVLYRVVYTDHFVRRLTCDAYRRDTGEKNREAALRHVRESDVYAKIVEAIELPVDGIAAWLDNLGYEFRAVIKSPTYFMNMGCGVSPRGSRAVLVRMYNILIKDPARYGTEHKEIWVNPKTVVSFARYIDETLREAVIAHLKDAASEMKVGYAYDKQGDNFLYTVDVTNGVLFVDVAEWEKDTYVIEVA